MWVTFLFDMKTPPHQVIRTTQSETPTRNLLLSLQIEGFTVLNQFGRECVLSPGSLAIYHSGSIQLDYPQPQIHGLVLADLYNCPSAVEQITAQAISREDSARLRFRCLNSSP